LLASEEEILPLYESIATITFILKSLPMLRHNERIDFYE
jgi:hypothetical protein